MRPKIRKPTDHDFEKAQYYSGFKCKKCGFFVMRVGVNPGKCSIKDLTPEEQLIKELL